MSDKIVAIAKSHGFDAIPYTDGTVAIIIPTTRNGVYAGDVIEEVRTVREAFDALGY